MKIIKRAEKAGRIMLFLLLLALAGGMCGCGLNLPGSQSDNSTKKEKSATGNAEQAGEKENESSTTQEITTRAPKDVTKEDYSNLSKKYNSWWFKRNMDHMPSGAQEEIDIAKYRACYVDQHAMQGQNVDKVVYLTFDCGYDNGYTETMLDILKKHNAPAAFFVTQTYIRDSKDIVVRMKQEGHIVGNHTVTHPNLSEASVEKIKEEITVCQEYMKEATGYDMDLFFRPPKGEYSEYLLQVAKDLGYSTIFWSLAYLDYDVNQQPSVEHVIEHWNNYYHPGCIPLIHNVSSANAGALDTILTNLENEGYRFGTLYEIPFDEN